MKEEASQNNQNKYQSCYERLELPSKIIILKEGEIARYTYYIEKGCVRIGFNDEGKDITLNFFFEGEGVSSIESFRDEKPSLFFLETLEPSIIYRIDKKNFRFMLEDSPAFKSKIEETTFQQLFMYQKLFLSLIRDSAEKRYKALMKNQPEILHRIPQHYIASYLGITSVSLSRIRNKI